MALTLDKPYSFQGVVFGSSPEIIEVHEIIQVPTVFVTLEFEAQGDLPPKRVPITVWSGEDYPGFGEWTREDLEAKIEEILS